MSEQVQIRPLAEGGEPPFALLYLADPSEEAVRDYLARGTCYVAHSADGRIVGEYVLLPTRPFTAELVNVAVDEEFQGQGYGRMLVMHAIETARGGGYRTLEVGTGDAGIGQLALYQKCGFAMSHIDTDFFRRHYPEAIFENGIECRHMVRLGMDL